MRRFWNVPGGVRSRVEDGTKQRYREEKNQLTKHKSVYVPSCSGQYGWSCLAKTYIGYRMLQQKMTSQPKINLKSLERKNHVLGWGSGQDCDGGLESNRNIEKSGPRRHLTTVMSWKRHHGSKRSICFAFSIKTVTVSMLFDTLF